MSTWSISPCMDRLCISSFLTGESRENRKPVEESSNGEYMASLKRGTEANRCDLPPVLAGGRKPALPATKWLHGACRGTCERKLRG